MNRSKHWHKGYGQALRGERMNPPNISTLELIDQHEGWKAGYAERSRLDTAERANRHRLGRHLINEC